MSLVDNIDNLNERLTSEILGNEKNSPTYQAYHQRVEAVSWVRLRGFLS